jgi:hypothetical protein
VSIFLQHTRTVVKTVRIKPLAASTVVIPASANSFTSRSGKVWTITLVASSIVTIRSIASNPASHSWREPSGTPVVCLPPADRFAMVQHHLGDRPPRPLATVRTSLLGRYQQPLGL